MSTQDLIRLAFKAIIGNKLRSFLTTLGIIIGVFAIIMLVSIGTGLQSYIANELSSFGSNLIFIIPGRIGGARTPGGVVANKLLLSDAKNLQMRLKSVAQVAPVISQSTNIKRANKTNKNTGVLGTTANYPDIVKNSTLIKGSFFTPGQERSGSKVVIIGYTVYTNLFGLTQNPIGQTITIGNTRYVVIGLIGKRGSTFGVDQDNIAIVPFGAAKQQFGINNVNAIYMSALRPELVPYVKNQAEKLLLKRLTEDDFTVQTAESSLSIVNSITGVLTLALAGIAAISLLVGGIGVANIMLVSVTERTKEIGLRKALGAKRNDILKQFLLEAIILSVTGGVIGILMGLGASMIVARLLFSTVTWWSVFLAFGFSVMVGVVFGMAPAIRASKLSPIDALRYE